MIIPMIAITTSISISVKPPCRSRRFSLRVTRPVLLIILGMDAPFSSDYLTDRQQRRHDRHDQSAHDNADHHDGDRPDHRRDAVELTLQLRLVEFGHPASQRCELAGLLA